MTYDIYRYIFLGGAGLAALSLVVAIILFFVLNIPSVIGDLTGSKARKAIENIRNQNERSGDKTYKSSAVNRERGRLTERISASGTLVHNPTGNMGGAMATTKIATQQLAAEAKQAYDAEFAGNETTVLHEVGNETTVLTNNETTLLSNDTTVLENNETTVLSSNMAAASGGETVFEIEYEIELIHTYEVIA